MELEALGVQFEGAAENDGGIGGIAEGGLEAGQIVPCLRGIGEEPDGFVQDGLEPGQIPDLGAGLSQDVQGGLIDLRAVEDTVQDFDRSIGLLRLEVSRSKVKCRLEIGRVVLHGLLQTPECLLG